MLEQNDDPPIPRLRKWYSVCRLIALAENSFKLNHVDIFFVPYASAFCER